MVLTIAFYNDYINAFNVNIISTVYVRLVRYY